MVTGRSPKEVLRKITAGDPLELRGRCRTRIDDRCVFVDVEQMFLRGLARVAYGSMRYDGVPVLTEWVDGILDQVIEDLLDEDRTAAQEAIPLDRSAEARFAFLSESLGVSPDVARKVAVVFNDLPLPVRRCYWAVVIRGRSLAACVTEGLGPRDELERNLKRAVLAMSLLDDPGPSDSRTRGAP